MSLPLDFLQTASRASLEEYELTRLNEAEKIEKQIKALLKQWVALRAGADLARVLIENEALRGITLDPRQEQFNFPESEGTGSAAPASHQKSIRVDRAAD